MFEGADTAIKMAVKMGKFTGKKALQMAKARD